MSILVWFFLDLFCSNPDPLDLEIENVLIWHAVLFQSWSVYPTCVRLGLYATRSIASGSSCTARRHGGMRRSTVRTLAQTSFSSTPPRNTPSSLNISRTTLVSWLFLDAEGTGFDNLNVCIYRGSSWRLRKMVSPSKFDQVFQTRVCLSNDFIYLNYLNFSHRTHFTVYS